MAGFFRLTPDGKIADERYYYDRMDLMQQLNPPAVGLNPERRMR